MGSFNLDIAEIETEDGFSPLKPGNYLMQVIGSDVQPNKKGTGEFVKLEIEILEPNAGRMIFEYFNIKHEVEATQKIGQKNLKVIQKLTKLNKFDESEQCHNIPFYADITIKVGNLKSDGSGEKWSDSNSIDFSATKSKASKSTPAAAIATPQVVAPAPVAPAPVAPVAPAAIPEPTPTAPPSSEKMPWE